MSAHFTHCLAATLPVMSSAAPEGRSLGSPDWLSLQRSSVSGLVTAAYIGGFTSV